MVLSEHKVQLMLLVLLHKKYSRTLLDALLYLLKKMCRKIFRNDVITNLHKKGNAVMNFGNLGQADTL